MSSTDGAQPDLADFGPFVPSAFAAQVASRAPEPDVDGEVWLRSLPRLVAECADAWDLVATGPVRHGACAVVVPVRRRNGEPAAFKVGWPHTESEHEHLALRAWNGDGAARLLAADPHRGALLLEWLDADRDLTSEPLLDACEIVGSLLARLDRPALPRVRRLTDEAQRWGPLLRAGHPGVPRRMTDRAAALLAEVADEPARLVDEDLHFANVLAGDREPWLAIDPKPITAPPEWGVAPVLWNREAETAAAHSARVHLQLRLSLVTEAAGLDEDLARACALVRAVLNATWAARDGSDREVISRMLTIAKAMAA